MGPGSAPVLAGVDCREDGTLNDGDTRKLDRADIGGGVFLTRYRVSLMVVEGRATGSEYTLEGASCTIGRGPGVDIALADESMSRQHAALEVARDGFKVRDLGSTNGLIVNGSPVTAADLKHGDRIRLGEHTLQYIVEERERVGTYDLSDDA